MMFERVGDGGIPPLPTTAVFTDVEEVPYSLLLTPDTAKDSTTVSEKVRLLTSKMKELFIDCDDVMVIDVGNVVTSHDGMAVPFEKYTCGRTSTDFVGRDDKKNLYIYGLF